MKILNNPFLHSTAAALLIASSHSVIAADTIVFDPDGAGNSPHVSFNTFQFGAGNSLFQGTLPFTVGNQFQLLFQAQLNSIVTSSGAQITPTGLNATGAVGAVTPFEVTIVGSITETVTNSNSTPPRVVYRLANTQALASFVELYYHGLPNANPLQGTGYNDGVLILRGMPVAANPDVGTFSLTNPQPSPPPNFDSFGTNDYSGVSSIVGVGGTKLDVTVSYIDPAFFVAPGVGDTGRQVHIGDVISLDLSHAAPFDKVDPSHKFAAVSNSGTGSGPTPAATPRLAAN